MVNTINQHRCSHPFSREFFLALPTDAFWHPTLVWGWGAKIQESAAYRGNKLWGQKSKKAQHTEETSCAVRKKLPRIQTTRKIEKPKRLEGRHHKKPHEPTLDIPPPVNRLRFPSLSLEKDSGRPCAFICVQCHFSSGDFMCFFLRVKVYITNTWFGFYLYPGEPP